MGNKITHCGGQGMGASLKMVMNQLLGTGMAAFAEGLVFGESLGLLREVLFEALLGGPAAAPFLAAKRERIEQGNYEPADFPLRWLQKDLHLAAVSAYETGVPMPLTNLAKEIYRFAIREGDGDKDFSAIYDYLARDHNAKPTGNEHTAQSGRSPKKPRTSEPLSEVALSCGFADQSHFTREFRRQFGRTPGEYRGHYQALAAVPVTKTAARKQ